MLIQTPPKFNSMSFDRFRRFLLTFPRKMVAANTPLRRRHLGPGNFASEAGLATPTPDTHHQLPSRGNFFQPQPHPHQPHHQQQLRQLPLRGLPRKRPAARTGKGQPRQPPLRGLPRKRPAAKIGTGQPRQPPLRGLPRKRSPPLRGLPRKRPAAKIGTGQPRQPPLRGLPRKRPAATLNTNPHQPEQDTQNRKPKRSMVELILI